jgi:hypothetical protein
MTKGLGVTPGEHFIARSMRSDLDGDAPLKARLAKSAAAAPGSPRCLGAADISALPIARQGRSHRGRGLVDDGPPSRRRPRVAGGRGWRKLGEVEIARPTLSLDALIAKSGPAEGDASRVLFDRLVKDVAKPDKVLEEYRASVARRRVAPRHPSSDRP